MTTDMSVTDAEYTADLLDWRQGRDDDLTREDGWLSVVGLDWLHEGENTVGSAPDSDVTLPDSAPARLGTITVTGDQVDLHVTADTYVTVGGLGTTGVVLRPTVHEDPRSRIQIGPVSIYIIRRGDRFAARVRDRENAARTTFGGRKWYPADSAYRVAGTFTPHEPARTVEVVTSAGMQTAIQNVGRVAFTLHGQALALEAFAGGRDDELWFIFRDATSGKATYGAGRFLYASLDEGGTVDLDFNRAYHPPCAFTAYATCPLPPRENILPVPVEAGEHN